MLDPKRALHPGIRPRRIVCSPTVYSTITMDTQVLECLFCEEDARDSNITIVTRVAHNDIILEEFVHMDCLMTAEDAYLADHV